VLEGFAFGVVLVDENLRIVHANAAAQAMLAAHDPIRSEEGVLTLSLDAAQASLARAVLQAEMDDTNLGARGIGIPARRKKGDPCVIHLLPLRHGSMRRDLGERAAAALFIAPRTIAPSMPADALALLYDLTPAENRVCEMICAGMTLAAIGRSLGVAPSTVKTHLLRVFNKTGTKRQVALVKLATSLSLPV